MTDDKLKPCPTPWCEGGYALDVIKRGDCFANGYLVACRKCHVEGPYIAAVVQTGVAVKDHKEAEAEAITLWNQRATGTQVSKHTELADRLTPDEAWHDLINKSDRTSPEEYPDMALVTFAELEDYMNSAQAPDPQVSSLVSALERIKALKITSITDSHAGAQNGKTLIIAHSIARAALDGINKDPK